MKHTKFKLPNSIKKFLMLDVYEKASDEDKEFLGAMVLAAKVANSISNPISLIATLLGTLRKTKLAF